MINLHVKVFSRIELTKNLIETSPIVVFVERPPNPTKLYTDKVILGPFTHKYLKLYFDVWWMFDFKSMYLTPKHISHSSYISILESLINCQRAYKKDHYDIFRNNLFNEIQKETKIMIETTDTI